MNKKRSGLTVLEIILSAAIVAVAAAIIAQVFFFVGQAYGSHRRQ